MANTYTLIEAKNLTSAAASITFTAIPGTYTDLRLFLSAKGSYTGGPYDYWSGNFNGVTTSTYTSTVVNSYYNTEIGNGQGTGTAIGFGAMNGSGSGSTANTFTNTEMYIPNYAGSTNKPYSVNNVVENNGIYNELDINANLWSNTAAITSIYLVAQNGDFVSGSSFYLYGIKNS